MPGALRASKAGPGGETGTPERAIIPSATDIYLPEGFQPGWIYELLYTAQDPKVMGLGPCRGARCDQLPEI